MPNHITNVVTVYGEDPYSEDEEGDGEESG